MAKGLREEKKSKRKKKRGKKKKKKRNAEKNTHTHTNTHITKQKVESRKNGNEETRNARENREKGAKLRIAGQALVNYTCV